MTYKIFDVGTVAIFLDEGPGGRILGLTLPEGEKLPGEFKIGDSVELTNHPSHPAEVAMGHITGYYEIRHIASGRTFKSEIRGDTDRLPQLTRLQNLEVGDSLILPCRTPTLAVCDQITHAAVTGEYPETPVVFWVWR